MANLLELHAQSYPDMPLEEFARRVHAKSYSDMPFEEFAQRAGLSQASESADAYQSPGNMGFGNRDRMSDRDRGFISGWQSQQPVQRTVELAPIAPENLRPERIPRGIPGDGIPDRGMRDIPFDPARDGVKGETFQVQSVVEPLRPFLKGMEDTASYGFSDEMSANRDFARGEMEGMQTRAPKEFLAGQFAGALASPGGVVRSAATRLGNAVRFGAQSAAQAGLYGFGSGEGAQDRIESGITSAAVGGLLGAGLGALVPGTRAATPRQPPTASAQKPMTQGQEAVLAAERLGIPLPRFLASDSKLTREVAAGLSSTPGPGTILKNARDRAVEAAGQKVDETTQRLGTGSFEGASNTARKGLETGMQRKADKVSARYDAVEKLIDPTKTIRLNETEKVVSDITTQLANAGYSKGSRAVNEVYDAVVKSASEGINFEGVKLLRTKVREMMDNLPEGTSMGEVKRIYSALTADLKRSAAASGSAALKAFNTANNAMRGKAVLEERLAPILDADKGAQALSRLRGMTQEGKASLDPKVLAAARKTMGKDAWNETVSGLLGQMGRTADGEFSGARWVTDYEKLSPGAKNALFDKSARESLDNVYTVLKQINQSDRLSNTSNTARNVLVGGGLIGGAFDPLSTIAVASQGMLAGGGIAFALSRPATSRAFKQWASVKTAQMRPARASRVRVNPRSVRRASYALATELARQYDLTTKQAQALAESLANGGKAAYAEGEQQR